MKNLVAGVTRWRRRLDFVLDELTGHRVAQVPNSVEMCCRLTYVMALQPVCLDDRHLQCTWVAASACSCLIAP